MNKILILCAALIVSVYGTGELSILHHPNSVVLKGHDPVKESTLPEVYSAVLGFSTEHYSNWRGVFIEDPFSLAEAVCTIVVDGVADIDLQKGYRFPLRTNEEDYRVYHTLEKRVTERYPTSNNHLINIDLSNGLEDIEKYNIFHGIKSDKPKKTNYNFLKPTVEEDREFLKEITLLKSITEKIEQGVIEPDNTPDIFWFKLSGLHAISDLYGENSTTVKEANQILREAILALNAAITKAYNGDVFVSVITSDAIHTRRTRSVLEVSSDTADDNVHNLAQNYDENYPVIFNIMLWFGVVMVFSLLAICIAIADMDPGRDSIIYRMTSIRMKKDN